MCDVGCVAVKHCFKLLSFFTFITLRNKICSTYSTDKQNNYAIHHKFLINAINIRINSNKVKLFHKLAAWQVSTISGLPSQLKSPALSTWHLHLSISSLLPKTTSPAESENYRTNLWLVLVVEGILLYGICQESPSWVFKFTKKIGNHLSAGAMPQTVQSPPGVYQPLSQVPHPRSITGIWDVWSWQPCNFFRWQYFDSVLPSSIVALRHSTLCHWNVTLLSSNAQQTQNQFHTLKTDCNVTWMYDAITKKRKKIQTRFMHTPLGMLCHYPNSKARKTHKHDARATYNINMHWNIECWARWTPPMVFLCRIAGPGFTPNQ